MESITKLLKDPSWWFTAVFIGILASLTASYFRDAISSAAARLSGSLRARRAARLAREQRRIAFLVAHPDLLIMDMVRCTMQLVLFVAAFGVYISLPSFLDVLGRIPELRRFDFVSADTSRRLGVLLVPLFGAMAAYSGVRATSRLRIVMQARRDCERSRKASEPRPLLSPNKSAAPNGGPATQLGNSGVTEGPPSVS